MEDKSKGMSWLGKIYQKFEAMCMEVDDIVCPETLRYVESQLQTVGSNVQQFYAELIEELVLSSSTGPVEEVKSNQVQNIVVTAYEDLNISVDEYHSQMELIDSSSEKSVEGVNSGLSSKQTTEDMHPLVQSSGSAPSGPIIFAQTFSNELQDNDSTVNDILLESMKETPLLEEIKIEESYFIVDSSEVHSLYNELEERRSYKKTFREAFFSKLGLAKRDSVTNALSGYTDEQESQEDEFSESNWEIVEASSS